MKIPDSEGCGGSDNEGPDPKVRGGSNTQGYLILGAEEVLIIRVPDFGDCGCS